ncbi:MAG: phage holin family protein [Patescibacteria group bacterium]
MKTLLRHYVVDTVALYLVSQIASGMVFEGGAKSLLLTGVGLMASSLVVKPIINILILPLNLITFGLFKWVSAAVALYVVTLVVPGFRIIEFVFAGLTTKWIGIPGFAFSGLAAFIAFSFALSFLTSFIYWLIK